MKIKKKNRLIAAIDVGSHALTLKIAEADKDKGYKIIESLRKSIALGRDAFAMGQVSFETVDETCSILQNFCKCLADYDVHEYRTVATSALREAKNRDNIIDLIKLRTGLSVKVLDNSEERYLTMIAIVDAMENYDEIRRNGAILIDIGSGSIQVSTYCNGLFELSQNIRLGSLRIRELLASLEARTLDFPRIMEEYIEGNIDAVGFVKSCGEFNNFIVTGSEIALISQICGRNSAEQLETSISKEDFEAAYRDSIYKSTQALSEELGITSDRAELLLPAMMLLKKFFDLARADKVYTPMAALSDGILSDLCSQRSKRKDIIDPLIEDILSSASCLARKFSYHEAHAKDVEEKSIALFDALRKLHGMGSRERFLLRIAAILHDTGKYISLNDHYIHSYHIIMASDLIGLSHKELEIVANVARYHSKEVPTTNHANFSRMDQESRIITAKLVAIIRIADALDRSHRQKIKDIRVTLDDDKLVIRAAASQDILLEEWTFETKADFFREVFGVAPIMKTKREMLDAEAGL